MATVETNTVTLTIDGREIAVAKGMLAGRGRRAGRDRDPGVLLPAAAEAASAPAACAWCEVEGMPRLQTACTTPVADGMVVTPTPPGREAQNGVLEFLLLNHPLDCPICDKGGECPLQDHTFSYGPGATRLTSPSARHDKPVPISPLIVLDRERCILCYRCARFSRRSRATGSWPPDRGANSMIATFEGRPYDRILRQHHRAVPGRRADLDHVPLPGAAVGAPEHPTVCRLRRRLQHLGLDREGNVVRMLPRENIEVDDGWLCDRGRYALGRLRAPDRVTSALIRGVPRARARAQGDALEHVSERLRTTAAEFGEGSIAVL